jgi:hypothetical protein
MTDDDALVERLRRTLQAEAAAITPRPEGQPAEHYPAPVPLRRGMPRWPLAVTAAAVVAAAVTLAALNWPSGGSSRIGIVSPGPSTIPPPATVPTTVPSAVVPPVTVPAGPRTTFPTLTTIPPAAPVPIGFAPLAVTFVTPFDGWAAGAVPCGTTSCLALAQTIDAGRTWRDAPSVPNVTVASATPDRSTSVRFANQMDGWIYTSNPTRLYATHDGGAHWRQDTAGIAAGSTIMGMETAGGYVRVALLPFYATSRGPKPGAAIIHVESSPVSKDTWTDADTGVAVGGGPVPSVQLVLHGAQGWLLEDDRTVVGGARLTGSGQWAPWTPPCLSANGTATLAASSATDLVAVCQEGTWGAARNLPSGATTPSTWAFQSSDGGTSFQAVGPLPAPDAAQQAASPAPSTIVAAGSLNGTATPAGGLFASFDGGHTWQTVGHFPGITGWADLGFTTLTQGVAIGTDGPSHSFLYMTRDGGHHWAAVFI